MTGERDGTTIPPLSPVSVIPVPLSPQWTLRATTVDTTATATPRHPVTPGRHLAPIGISRHSDRIEDIPYESLSGRKIPAYPAERGLTGESGTRH